jgi:hypothetical protein
MVEAMEPAVLFDKSGGPSFGGNVPKTTVPPSREHDARRRGFPRLHVEVEDQVGRVLR